MALEQATQDKVVRLVNDHWTARVRDAAFAELIKGKEPGHRMADYVDDRTTALMKVNLDTRYEGNANGSPKKRSMGDVWVHSSGIFNPVNIKSGLQGMKGQPNLVSMQKLLDYIFRAWIDSYYLLIIKFDRSETITHKTFLVDLLDWTDFITYDAGPGQIMLRETEFYEEYESGGRPQERPIFEKIQSLMSLFQDGVHKLFANRKQRVDRQKKLFDHFSGKSFKVDQSGMTFVP